MKDAHEADEPMRHCLPLRDADCFPLQDLEAGNKFEACSVRSGRATTVRRPCGMKERDALETFAPTEVLHVVLTTFPDLVKF